MIFGFDFLPASAETCYCLDGYYIFVLVVVVIKDTS